MAENVLTKEIAEEFLVDPMDLSEFTAIDDDAAESLSKYSGEYLYLKGLTSLSDAAAESLSKYEGFLNLEGLTELAEGPGHIALVERLSKQEVSNSLDFLDLSQLNSLSVAAAESLSQYEGTLHLDGLKTLSDAVAEALSKHTGGRNDVTSYRGLHLCPLSLSDAAAESLSKYSGEFLSLRGLTRLSDAAAESLSKYEGALFLNNLRELTDSPGHIALAESLSKQEEGWLYLTYLASLSDAAAESLSKHRKLDLSGLKSLSDAAAESLSNSEGVLNLQLCNLPASAAEILRQHPSFQDDE